jgi:hypothetical protein
MYHPTLQCKIPASLSMSAPMPSGERYATLPTNLGRFLTTVRQLPSRTPPLSRTKLNSSADCRGTTHVWEIRIGTVRRCETRCSVSVVARISS